MTILWEFLGEVWTDMQGREPAKREKMLRHWDGFMQCFAFFDGSKHPRAIKIRKEMERVVAQDLPLRDRKLALIALWRPYFNGGTFH